jgi:osmotically inducible protein OsmC
MALSGQLAAAKLKAERIAVEASVSLDKLAVGWTVTEIHLTVTAKLSGDACSGAYHAAAEAAKAGCPMSRLLGAAAKITMDARLA